MSKLNDQLNAQDQSQSQPRSESQRQGDRNIITGMTDEVAYRYDQNFLGHVETPVGDVAREIRRQSKLYESRQYVKKPDWWSGELHKVEPGGIFDMSEAD